MSEPILPGATLGVIGGGQLGRMFAIAARQMGYRIVVFSDSRECPAGQVADRVEVIDFGEPASIRAGLSDVAAVTYETENLPLALVEQAADLKLVRPGLNLLGMSQHRLLEKTTLRDLGLPVADFLPVATEKDLVEGSLRFAHRCVLKTTMGGYDGKGQWGIRDAQEADAVRGSLAAQWRREAADLADTPWILERFVDFELEFSMLAARSFDGGMAFYGPILNDHRDHILDVSVCPAGLADRIAAQAERCLRRLAEALDVAGLFCIEFFLTSAGEILINEVAPRPHNSGHLTMEAHATSQFAQQVRALCGLPLGDATQLRPAAMANLLGDLWGGGEPRWAAMLAVPGANLHLYGKREPRSQRKMGHITATAASGEAAAELARQARQRLADR